MKERSEQNKALIEKLRLRSLVEKKQKNRSMIETSRKSKINLKELSENRLEEIKKDCQK